jgi:hypothetical protein
VEVNQQAAALQGQQSAWHLAVGFFGLGGAWYFRRRGQKLRALFLAIFGLRIIWLAIPFPGQIAPADYVHIDLWWLIGVTATALLLAARGQLNTSWSARLLMVTIVSELIVRVDWFEDPLAPLLAGLGLVVASAVWDIVNSGVWANTGSASFPRAGRVFAYLGYALFSLTTIHWVVVLRSQGELDVITDLGVLQGFELFGKPLLYAAMIMTIGEGLRATIRFERPRWRPIQLRVKSEE